MRDVASSSVPLVLWRREIDFENRTGAAGAWGCGRSGGFPPPSSLSSPEAKRGEGEDEEYPPKGRKGKEEEEARCEVWIRESSSSPLPPFVLFLCPILPRRPSSRPPHSLLCSPPLPPLSFRPKTSPESNLTEREWKWEGGKVLFISSQLLSPSLGAASNLHGGEEGGLGGACASPRGPSQRGGGD